jgi:hypothetical protein
MKLALEDFEGDGMLVELILYCIYSEWALMLVVRGLVDFGVTGMVKRTG